MVRDVEYRYELKFVISDQAAELLKNQLKQVMDLDEHSVGKDYSYKIRSLYFDDVYSNAYFDKLDGVEYRSKYRIRYYNGDDSVIKLECKHKDENMTYKEDCTLKRELIEAILDCRYGAIKTNNDFLNRFLAEAMVKNLRPSVIVDYKRLAFVYPVSDVRITFDSEIRSGRYNVSLFDENMLTYDVLDDGQQVLEVKCNEFIPAHILSILNSVPMVRQAVSKFALCRSIK